MGSPYLYVYHIGRLLSLVPCTIGNTLVIVAIHKYEVLQTPCNIFVLSSAVSNMLAGTFLTPLLAVLDFVNIGAELPGLDRMLSSDRNWDETNTPHNITPGENSSLNNMTKEDLPSFLAPALGHENSQTWVAFCSLAQNILFTSVKGNLFSIFLIAADRFICIQFPLRYTVLMTTSRAVSITIICWVINLGFTVWTGVTSPPTSRMLRCFTNNVGAVFMYGVLGPVLGVVTVGVVVIYSRISYIAWKHARNMKIQAVINAPRNVGQGQGEDVVGQGIKSGNGAFGMGSGSKVRSGGATSAQVRMTKTMLLIVGVYIVTNIPLFVLSSVQKISTAGPPGAKLPNIKSEETLNSRNDTIAILPKMKPNSFLSEKHLMSSLTRNDSTGPSSPVGGSPPDRPLGFPPGPPPDGPTVAMTFLLLLWLANTWVNPIVYGFRYREFKNAFNKLFHVRNRLLPVTNSTVTARSYSGSFYSGGNG